MFHDLSTYSFIPLSNILYIVNINRSTFNFCSQTFRHQVVIQRIQRVLMTIQVVNRSGYHPKLARIAE